MINPYGIENFKGDKFEVKIHTIEHRYPILVIHGQDGRLIELGLEDVKKLQDALEHVKQSALRHVTP